MAVRSLADFKKRPHTTMLDCGEATVSQLIDQCLKYEDSLKDKAPAPEDLALRFYCMNAASALVASKVELNQPLSEAADQILVKYYDDMEDIGLRAFFYTFLICTREARHGNYGSWTKSMIEEWGNPSFLSKIPDSADSIFDHLKKHPPMYTVKKFTELLVKAFEPPSHYGSGYGGKAWAAVARPLRDFCNGQITMEMFLDTVWTLAHNNGPIFNKGMLFGTYGSDLVKILDVQRAGMVPNMIQHGETHHVGIHHKKLLELARKLDPEFGMSPVDWAKVQELGAKGKYANLIKKKKAAPPILKMKSNPTVDVNLLEIMPKVYVTKVTRKAIHA